MEIHISHNHEAATKPTSNRTFGLIFGFVWAMVGVAPLLRRHSLHRWALILSFGFGITALLVPKALSLPNRIWTKFGAVIHSIVSPIILFAAYVVSMLPTALILRALGKDPLRRKFDRSATSYWIPRNPRAPAGVGMKDQF